MNVSSLQVAIDEIRYKSPFPAGIGDRIGGFQKRFSNNPLSRWLVRHVITRFLATALVRFELFGISKGRDAAEIALSWQKLAAFFKVETVIERAGPDEVVLVHPHCTMGYSDAKHLPLCDASMNLDHELVRRLGGELTILHRRLEGGENCCRHQVRLCRR